MHSIIPGQYPVASSGIDWLYLRTSDFQVANSHHALVHDILVQAKTKGEKVQDCVRAGFAGKAVEGAFIGGRESVTMVTLSGPVARDYGPVALRLGGQIARLDLQVTIDTGTTRPNLAAQGYHQAQVVQRKGGRPPQLQLTQVFKEGATVNINSRKTDQYGRLYDWSSAHKQGAQYQFWRYEVEFKRSTARRVADLLVQHEDCDSVTEALVHGWYLQRLGIVPFTPRGVLSTDKLPPDRKSKDVLRWFEESLSVTVGRAIKDYGLERVLKSLGLQAHLDHNRKEV